MTALKFRLDFWSQKTRVCGLLYGVVLRDSTFSRFDTIPACDGRIDGHTTTAYRASIASLGENTGSTSSFYVKNMSINDNPNANPNPNPENWP